MANYDPLSFSTLIDSSGVAAAGAKISYFETGSTTPKAVYSNAALTSAITQPVTCDSLGVMPVVYLSAGRYKRTVTTSTGTTLSAYAADPIDSSQELIAASAAPSTTYAFLRYHNTSDGHVYRRDSTNSSWIDEGAVDSLGNAATVTQQLAGTATTAFCTPDSVAALWQRGTDIASASTMSLPFTGGNEFNVTGTTTITGISTAAGGRKVRFKFASALKITYNATSMVIPGAADLSVPAGAMVEFTNEAAQDATGANWRVSNISFGNNVPLVSPLFLSKTASYTVTDADRGALIRFTALAADATLTLPAAAGRAGFEVTIVNASVFADNVTNATPFGVIVDPNASETIDGFTTRKTFAYSRVTIVCDGSNWYTKSGKWRFVSAHQVVTASASVAVAHSLGVRPDMVGYYLQCTTADLNYTQYDIVYGYPDNTDGGFSTGIVMIPDATNINYRVGTTAMWMMNKTTNAVANMTAASWRAIFWAEA